MKSLRTLVAIAEHGSFAVVAERLNMTLSAVSMQMKSLEAELDAELFDRRFRPPKMTPAGRAAAARARDVLAAEDRLREAVSGADELRGDYRIGFILTASVRVLPGFLSRSQAAAPQARFLTETGLSEDLEARVLHGELDGAVVTRAETEDPGLTLRRIASEEIVFAFPPDHTGLALDQAMAELPFLQFMPRTGIGVLIARALAAQGLRPAQRIVLDGIEAIAECVREGLGFTALPRPDLTRYLGTDAALRSLPRPLWRDMVLATRAGSATDRSGEALLALLR